MVAPSASLRPVPHFHVCGPYFSADMLGGDVVPVIVLIDSGVVRIRILLAWMLGFARFWVSALCLSIVYKLATHVMMAVVALAGTSAFSIALAKASCTLGARL